MILGEMLLSIDPDQANGYGMSNDFKILVLADDVASQPIFNTQNVLAASILLPPYESVMADLDGNKAAAEKIYVDYLMRTDVDNYLCAVIRAMMSRLNIILFIGHDEAQMPFVSTLLNYLYNTFGITLATPYNRFSYNIAYDGIIANKLYFYGYITATEFMVLCPNNFPIEIINVPNLVNDLNASYMGNNIQEYHKYLEGFKQRIKINNNLKIPIVREIRQNDSIL